MAKSKKVEKRTRDVIVRMRCRAFTGDKLRLNQFVVSPANQVKVWDNVADSYTFNHALSKAQNARVLGLARKAWDEGGWRVR